MNTILVASLVLVLESFDNPTLAALNNDIRGFGSIAQENIAYIPALEAGLIMQNGNAIDLESLRDASAFEVNRRLDAGTFN